MIRSQNASARTRSRWFSTLFRQVRTKTHPPRRPQRGSAGRHSLPGSPRQSRARARDPRSYAWSCRSVRFGEHGSVHRMTELGAKPNVRSWVRRRSGLIPSGRKPSVCYGPSIAELEAPQSGRRLRSVSPVLADPLDRNGPKTVGRLSAAADREESCGIIPPMRCAGVHLARQHGRGRRTPGTPAGCR